MLTDDRNIAESLLKSGDISAPLVLCTDDRPCPPGIHSAPIVESESIARILAQTDAAISHVRVIVDMGRTETAPAWPAPPPLRLVRLQELAFLAAQNRQSQLLGDGSFGFLALNCFPAGVPHPFTALFTGMLKSLAWELNRDHTFGVLTDRAQLEDALFELKLESAAGRSLPHAIYRCGVRHAQVVEPAPIEEPAPWPLRDGSVVVADAARGLTSSILTAIAERSRVRVWLLGLSPLDELPADVFEGGDEAFATRRPAFMDRLRAERPDLSPAELNRRFERLVDARDSHRGLERLRQQLGESAVRYLACDVTDPSAVSAAARTILTDSTKIDLLLHAAAQPGSRSLAKKTLENFRRVQTVKVDGYHNLKAHLADATRLWCSFGSVIGVLGLPGDPEYAAANDYLGAAAAFEQSIGGHDELAINWTWWRETGISTRPLRRAHMGRRAWLSGISTAEGINYFCTELTAPAPRAPRSVQIGDVERATFTEAMPGCLADAPRAPSRAGGGAFYLGQQLAPGTWSRTLEPARDANLFGHLVAGKATVPGSHALEMAAEAAMALRPGLVPHAFVDVTFSAFLRLSREHPTEFRIEAQVEDSSARPARVRVRVVSDVRAPNGVVLRRDRLHYQATVLLTERLPAPPRRAVWSAPTLRAPADPYYAAAGGVALTGAYASTTGCWLTESGSRSLLTVEPPLEPGLSEFVVPCLTVDALTRVPTPDPEHPDRLGIAVPLGYERVELFHCANDADLVAEYGTQLMLSREWMGDHWRCAAVDSEGRVLVNVERPKLRVIAMVE